MCKASPKPISKLKREGDVCELKSKKCYRDSDGNYISSDYVIFTENTEDIIDSCYIKDVWYKEPYEVYKEILKECNYIHKELFKGNL